MGGNESGQSHVDIVPGSTADRLTALGLRVETGIIIVNWLIAPFMGDWWLLYLSYDQSLTCSDRVSVVSVQNTTKILKNHKFFSLFTLFIRTRAVKLKVSEKHHKSTIKVVHTKCALYFKSYNIFFKRIRLKFKLQLTDNIAICLNFPWQVYKHSWDARLVNELFFWVRSLINQLTHIHKSFKTILNDSKIGLIQVFKFSSMMQQHWKGNTKNNKKKISICVSQKKPRHTCLEQAVSK